MRASARRHEWHAIRVVGPTSTRRLLVRGDLCGKCRAEEMHATRFKSSSPELSNSMRFARLLDVFSRRHRQTAGMRKGKLAQNRLEMAGRANRKAIRRQSRRIRFHLVFVSIRRGYCRPDRMLSRPDRRLFRRRRHRTAPATAGTKVLAHVLDRRSAMTVTDAKDGELIRPAGPISHRPIITCWSMPMARSRSRSRRKCMAPGPPPKTSSNQRRRA